MVFALKLIYSELIQHLLINPKFLNRKLEISIRLHRHHGFFDMLISFGCVQYEVI